MALRVGILSVAHMHVWGYAGGLKRPDVEIVGAWDDHAERLAKFCESTGIPSFADIDDLLGKVDAVVITSVNTKHAELATKTAEAGKHILCEKPLVTNEADAQAMLRAAKSVKVMTAFPCRYSPAFIRLRERVGAGEIGAVKAICATNRGRCPFDWFVERAASGGGAMIDHTVHVADLLRTLLGEEPVRVQAQTGNNMYGQDWDDTAMLTIEFESGIFATLDSSWSRPPSYKTWGDVTMNVVGEQGVIELDMFNQAIDRYADGNVTHTLAGYGSNLDAGLVDDFVRACIEDKPTPITAWDGIQAARVAIAGYESAASGQPVTL
ncbi:MAG TPA: Gfo/Idh/MocA family oxidoreductase [Fimbriimonadaceae bacterium]|nr:Gfo/Idh/MocA family oxidoreductase [Fimbriimonadaceae bacterium]